MKKSKQVLSLSLAAAMLGSATSAFAMPADTVVIGDKAFELDVLENADYTSQINDAIMNIGDGGIFYSISGGITDGFVDANDGTTKMTAEQQAALKDVVLLKADGTTETYKNFEDETPVAQADLTAYNAALAKVAEADYTAESWTAYKAVVDANMVTGSNTQAEVDAATAAITAAQANLVSIHGLAVESVSAINAAEEVVVATVDGAKNVLTNNTLKVTLSETLSAATVNANNVKLVKATNNVPVATKAPVLSEDKMSISVAPLAGTAFEKNTEYKIILGSALANENGTKTLKVDTTAATFTTANMSTLVDFEDNTNTSVVYSGNVTAIAATNNVFLEFSEALDPTSFTTANVRLKNITDAGSDFEVVTLAGAATNTKVQVTIGNASGLTAGKTYEVIFNGLRTANGGDVEDGSWKFVANGTAPAVATLTTTNSDNLNNAGADIGWGKITSGSLQDGTVKAGLQFYIGFNTDIDEDTIGAITLVDADGAAVSVTKAYDSTFKRVTMTPNADLAENKAYYVKIATTLKSTSGIALGAAYTSDSYTTYDLTKPMVTEVTGNVSNLAIGEANTISVKFDEAVTEYDVLAAGVNAPTAGVAFANNTSVRVRNLTGNVAMTNTPVVSMSADGKTMNITVTPAVGEENRTFEISLNAKDGTNAYIVDNTNATAAQKNSLAEDYTFTFTTEGADTAAPTVEKVFFGSAYSASATAVTSGVKNIDATKNMYIQFNEAMAGDAADKVSIDNTGLVAGTQNIELWSRAVGGSYALVAANNSDANAGAAAGMIRFTTVSGKSYLTIANADLAADTQYKLVITPSANAVEDTNGNDMAAAYTFEFATGGSLAWADPTTTAMGNDKTTTSQAIAAGAGSAASAFQTAADMNAAGLLDDEVIALEMTDGSFYFEQFANQADTTGANGQSLKVDLPAGSKSVASGATVVNMTDRSASFATLETGVAVSDPIAIRLSAAAAAKVDVSTVDTTNIKLVKVSDGTEVAYSLHYETIGNDTFVSINPDSDLETSTVYEVQVANVTDMIGNVITARNARFTTAAAATPTLAVSSVNPSDQTTGVVVNGSVEINFNSAPTSAISEVAVGVAGAGQIAVYDVTGAAYLPITHFTVTGANTNKWTVDFDSFLKANNVYRVELDDATTNATGSLGTDLVSTFQTEATASIKPSVTKALFFDADNNGVDAGDSIILSLNTEAAAASLTTNGAGDGDADFGLSLGGTMDAGNDDSNVAISADGKTITITLGTAPILVPNATELTISNITTLQGVSFDTTPVTITNN